MISALFLSFSEIASIGNLLNLCNKKAKNTKIFKMSVTDKKFSGWNYAQQLVVLM